MNNFLNNDTIAKPIKPVLICFSHLRWNFVYQRPQHLISRFATEYNILYVEEPVYIDGDTPTLQITEAQINISILVPQIPHGYNKKQVDNLQFQLLTEFLLTNQFTAYILWYYTPMCIQWSKEINAKIVIYDCMDELSAFKFAPPELKKLEQVLMYKADLIFTGGASLYKAKNSQHDAVYLFPSGVDIAHFSSARNNLLPPDDQKLIPYPRIGFYGVIDERFDIELLSGLAKARPEWNFIIIGPIVKIDPLTLPKADNIYYLGAKRYEELPYYLSGWDVALIPFAINKSTEFISPTKTPEYLAGGKPVVSTPIKDIVDTYKNTSLVHIASTDNLFEFQKAIKSALEKSKDPQKICEEADILLQKMSWTSVYLAMRELIIKEQTKKEVA